LQKSLHPDGKEVIPDLYWFSSIVKVSNSVFLVIAAPFGHNVLH
jgi:hypothetical protein